MKIIFLTGILFVSILSSCIANNTRLEPVKLSPEEIAFLKKDLESKNEQFDATANMLSNITRGKHYHSDLDSGVVVHETRASLEYATELLKTEDAAYMKRGVAIIKTVLPMQETDPSLPYCGVWPYYPEEPLKGRKAAVDYNWADFIAVPLIDVIINHSDYVGEELVGQIKDALILAAEAIKRRDVQPDYTNIAIMGTYVCYIAGDICDKPGLIDYARKRLAHFYDYTIRNKGFTEYNSPTYTKVAMDELLRMKQTIVQPDDKKIIDELYYMCWDIIARHFHQPSGQWCGPNLRAYSSLATPDIYRLLYNASNGIVNLPGDYPRIPNVIMPHQMPADLLPKFTNSTLPRLEIDTFVVANPELEIVKTCKNTGTLKDNVIAKDIVGKLYAAPKFALASVNQGYMWNQTRPLIAHWGTVENPAYLQVRFLHDNYDFSAANVTCVQDSTNVLAIFNVAEDGGDTHPGLDKIKNATVQAEDFRLRIEIGGDLNGTYFVLPQTVGENVKLVSRDISCVLNIPYAMWGNRQGYWQTGGDGRKIWADYILYSGEKHAFNFGEMKEAIIGLSLSMFSGNNEADNKKIAVNKDPEYLTLSNENMKVKALLKSTNELIIKNDYETECYKCAEMAEPRNEKSFLTVY